MKTEIEISGKDPKANRVKGRHKNLSLRHQASFKFKF